MGGLRRANPSPVSLAILTACPRVGGRGASSDATPAAVCATLDLSIIFVIYSPPMSGQLLGSYVTAVQAPPLLCDPEDGYQGCGGDSRTREAGQGPLQPSRQTETAPSSPSRVPSVPPSSPASQQPRLRDRLVEALRVRHYPIRTEEAYVEWNKTSRRDSAA